jgi:hypothetical protein
MSCGSCLTSTFPNPASFSISLAYFVFFRNPYSGTVRVLNIPKRRAREMLLLVKRSKNELPNTPNTVMKEQRKQSSTDAFTLP